MDASCNSYVPPYTNGMNNEQAKTLISANIRKRMADRKWTIRHLSRKTGDPVMSLHDAMSGKSLPRAGMLYRIAKAFDDDIDDLFSSPTKTRVSA